MRDILSRGFHLGPSHLRDPQRFERLLIACGLAYPGIVCLGAPVLLTGWLPRIHRSTRCDLSLFPIGWLWIDDCLNAGLPVPVRLSIRRFCPDRKRVRE